MHRIDGPGATVDNRFTDGDPVAGTQATIVTDDWANDVQEELISVLTAGGIAPVKGVQDQLLKAIRAISGGVVGSSRNVRMSITAASASGALSADQIYVSSSLSGQSYRLTSFNKTINLATTGAGGMDTGTAPVSGHVAIYAIYNPTTATSALLAVNATAVAQPEVYGGANMPAGYTASALVSVWGTTGSGLLTIGSQFERLISMQQAVVYNNGVTNVTVTPIGATILPKNAKSVSGNLTVSASTASGLSLAVYSNSAGSGQQINNSSVAAGGQNVCSFNRVLITTQQIIYMTCAIISGTGQNYVISLTSYEF